MQRRGWRLEAVTLVPPVVLTLLALLFGGTPFWLLAIASMPVSFLIAVIVAVALLFLRRNWEHRSRTIGIGWHHGGRD